MLSVLVSELFGQCITRLYGSIIINNTICMTIYCLTFFFLHRCLSTIIPCVDELIRQITINCAERGLLLLRVRDEARMTIAAYETLYESSIAYGIRKALMAEQKRTDLNAEMMHLQLRKKDLTAEATGLKDGIKQNAEKAAERRETEEKQHTDDMERIVRTNEQLKTSLENLLAAPSKK